jgi:hypothetical protein
MFFGAAAMGGGPAEEEASWGKVRNALPVEVTEEMALITGFRKGKANVGWRKTAALGELKVEGLSEEGMFAASGLEPRPGGVNMPTRPRFDVEPGWEAHSEVKLLEEVSASLETIPASARTGTLRITVDTTSKLGVCHSCQTVAQQFYEAYPGIQLEIVLVKPMAVMN